jgi:Domain of unknown function (DUF4194)
MTMSESIASVSTDIAPELSTVVVLLLKGVLYEENDAGEWSALLRLQARVRDYVVVMGLDLVLDEAEGYAFLKSRSQSAVAASDSLPRLIARRPLSFPVSLLLALLRKKLAEFDAAGGDTRLVLSRDEIVDLVRVFLPEGSNEAKLIDQVDTHINKIIELGLLRRLKPQPHQPAVVEVRRILKAFVDAQWLSEFDQKLEAYRAQLTDTLRNTGVTDSTDSPVTTEASSVSGENYGHMS